MIFTIFLTGYVQVVCGVNVPGYEGSLFCNAPYVLYIESSDGSKLEIERSGPNIRALEALPEGQTYVVEVTGA